MFADADDYPFAKGGYDSTTETPKTKLFKTFSNSSFEIWEIIEKAEPTITPEKIKNFLTKVKIDGTNSVNLFIDDPQKQYLNYYIYYIIKNINEFGDEKKMITENKYNFLLNFARFWDNSYGKNLNYRLNFLEKSIEFYKASHFRKYQKIKYGIGEKKYNYSETIKKKCGLVDNQILVSTNDDGTEYDIPYYDVYEIEEGRCESSSYLKKQKELLNHNVFDDPETHELYPISLFLPSVSEFQTPLDDKITFMSNLSNRQFRNNFNNIDEKTELINLDNNNLTVFPNLNSENLKNLKFLSIRGNNIGVNGLSTLQSTPNSLTNLDLSGNRISSVELCTTIPIELKSLNLSDNLISTLFLIRSHPRSKVDIENDIILPPNLACLYLDNNFIQNLNDINFNNLTILSLENNIITASGLFGVVFPPNLKYLNLNYNRLNDLKKFTIFQPDKKVTVMDYMDSLTRGDQKFEPAIKFPASLEFLSIDRNDLTDDDLNRLKLNSLVNLKYLSLQHNEITGKEVNMTYHLISPSLQILGLGNNPLTEIENLIPKKNYFNQFFKIFSKLVKNKNKNDNFKFLYLNNTKLELDEINGLSGYDLDFINIDESLVDLTDGNINSNVTKEYYFENKIEKTKNLNIPNFSNVSKIFDEKIPN